MRKGLWLPVVGISALSCAGALAGSLPRIGSSQSAVGHVWRSDGARCFGGICGYKAVYRQPLWIQVQFERNRATAFQVGFDPDRFHGSGPDPSLSAYWRLLTSFLPSGARRTTCRMIQKTGGDEGPAYACLYRYGKQTILVAHYLRSNIGMDIGQTDLGEGFDTIEAGT
jgi:hypothetical protein